MSQLGQRLKTIREEKNISLDELQNLTKIQKRYLKAIEDGNLQLLPGNFYARAFVKSYADAVGIDSEEVLEEFANELPKSNKELDELPPRVQSKKSPNSKRMRRIMALLPTVVAVLFIIGVAIGIWYFFQDDTPTNDKSISRENAVSAVEGNRDDDALNKNENEPLDEEKKEEVQSEEPDREEVVDVLPQEITLIETVGKESIYDLTNAEQFKVVIEFIGKSYVGIDNRKGKDFQKSNVDAGKTLSFDFTEEESIHFNFGASGNVKLFINETAFEFPQNIAHQKITINFKKEKNS